MGEQGTCDVCLGYPLESGRTCICGGAGTSADEKEGLRRRIYDAESTLREAVAVLGEMDRLMTGKADYEGLLIDCPNEPAILITLAERVRQFLKDHPELRQEDG